MNESEIMLNRLWVSIQLDNKVERARARAQEALKASSAPHVKPEDTERLKQAREAERNARIERTVFNLKYFPFLVKVGPSTGRPPWATATRASDIQQTRSIQDTRRAAASQQSRLPLPDSLQVRPGEDARKAAAAQQPRHEFPPGLQVDPSLSPGQDIHPPEYYTGGRSGYSYLSPSLRTNPSGSDIHPPGYHGGGGGPYMPPMFRTGGR